jgi:hypothetical protein
MPIPQENLSFVEQASCLLLTQDAYSTRKFIFCGTGILPVADNGARCELPGVKGNLGRSDPTHPNKYL